ncbi:MAG: HmuY family protein [candidate division WOR-3 bacterium]|nr:HmuY family protein [candidate division WOR-3 bacterium]
MLVRKTIIVVLISFGLFWGCKEENPTDGNGDGDGPGVIEYMIDVSSSEDWAYFSFSEGDSVSVSEPGTSLGWDLGFQRFRIKTNSGTSGPGSGGAINMGKIDFDALTEAPESGYVVDTIVTYADMGGEHEYSGNPELKDWYDMSGMPPTFTALDTVYMVKTADGKYAKVKILNYYDAQHNSGFITFKYVYQPDGSRNFE